MEACRRIGVRGGLVVFLVVVIGGWWLVGGASGDAEARSRRSSARKTPISFTHDWGGNSEVVSLYKVPKGYRLVLTDCQGFWWDEGAAQRFILYQGVEQKGAFLASSRGRKGTGGYTAFDSGWHAQQGGILFKPGSELRVIPSTTYLSVTLAGYIEPI